MEDKHVKNLEEFEHLAGFLKREYNTIKDSAPKIATKLLLICMEAYFSLSKELCNDKDFKDLFYKACDEFEAKRPSRKLTKEEESAEIMKIATNPQKYLKVLTQEELSKLCFREDCGSCIHNLYGTFPCTEINKREVQDYLAAKGKYSDKKYSCPEWYDEC